MMISAAAHTGDIEGAAAAGLRTASVARPDEFGPGTGATVPKTRVDVQAKTLNELADKLGS
jgi:2-haloacid dehalogenase